MALTRRSKKVLIDALRDMKGVESELDSKLEDIVAVKAGFDGSVISTPAEASQFDGQVAGMTTDVTIDADVPGTAGDITLVADSVKDIDTLISDWNTANPSNTVSLSAGDGSQVPTADITLSGGVDEVAFTFTVEADEVGTASNDSITGDGIKDCDTLIGELSEDYTISAGGAEIPASGEVVQISGGVDGETTQKEALSSSAKYHLRNGMCDKKAYEELITAIEAGSGPSALSSRTKKIMRWMFCDYRAYRDFLNNM